ncbi:MAG TPA: PLP-dependent aminotransferase family protein [Candidatus Acidoferrales bacterium]|nr:PLP-dependent aminotransferase family protein [Candidatus Acidoferrales bacterium]
MLPLQVQSQSHVPLYVQIRDQLRAMVHTGELRPGDRIPASRELAHSLGVHRTTVANAYAELESEGLIEGHVGRGTFICRDASGHAPVGAGNGGRNGQRGFTPAPPTLGNGALRWESLFADERGEEALNRIYPEASNGAISLVAARPAEEFFPIEELRSCVQAVLKDAGGAILQLGSTDGYEPLKRELLAQLNREGLRLKTEQLLVTAGVQQSLDLLCKAFLRPGDAVVLEDPTYPGSMTVFTTARVRCLGVPIRTAPGAPGGIDLEGVEAALAQNRVKFILVTPDCQNPTGASMPIESRRRLLDLAARHQVAVVEDCIYSRLRFSGQRVPSLRALDRSGIVIQIDSFSKIAFPGLRVGWCIAPENVIERLRLVKQATDLHTDQLAQATLAEFMRRGGLERHVKKMRGVYAERCEALFRALEKHMPEGVEWTRPEGGMCVWVTLPAGYDASELLIHARERGVLFAPGRYFFVQMPRPNVFRLGFAGIDERKIGRGIEILASVLREEMRKRQRGGWRRAEARVALV